MLRHGPTAANSLVLVLHSLKCVRKIQHDCKWHFETVLQGLLQEVLEPQLSDGSHHKHLRYCCYLRDRVHAPSSRLGPLNSHPLPSPLVWHAFGCLLAVLAPSAICPMVSPVLQLSVHP